MSNAISCCWPGLASPLPSCLVHCAPRAFPIRGSIDLSVQRAKLVIVQFGKRSVSGHRFSDAAKGDSSERLYSLQKNSIFDLVLKGRGFKPRRKQKPPASQSAL